MATSIDQKNFVKTALRLPPALHQAVHSSAQTAGRSYNAELVFLLERALSMPSGYIPAPRVVRSFDERGELIERNPKELFAELANAVRRASTLAELFRHYEDGEPEMPDITSLENDGRESETQESPAAVEKKKVPKRKKVP